MIQRIRLESRNFDSLKWVSVLIIFLSLHQLQQVQSKIYTRCELAVKLYEQHNISWKFIADWICLADSATKLNSSYIQVSPLGSNHTNYGIFRIHHLYWCYDGYEEANTCQMNCSDLVGDNITNSVNCAQIIFEKDNQFEAWSDWRQQCKGKDVKKYLRDCKFIPGQKVPTISGNRNKTFINEVENQYLSCEATGKPPPDLHWRYNKTKFPELFTKSDEEPGSTNGKESLKLFFPQMSYNYTGEFSCFAENIAGEAEAIFYVDVQEPVEQLENKRPLLYGLGFGLPIVIFIFTAIGTTAIYRRCYTRSGYLSQRLSAEEIQEFKYGNLEKFQKLKEDLYVCRENVQFQAYDKQFEVDEDHIQIENDVVFGSGQFGIVLKGQDVKSGVTVAVKTVQPNANKAYVKALLSELKIMIYLGRHQFLVNLIGARTKKLDQGLVYIFVEFCQLGDLENYLRQRKNSFLDLHQNHYINTSASTCSLTNSGSSYQINLYDHDPISTVDLYRWSFQIASGMEYLASKKVIHGDLAARNILLVDKTCAKITDFGLSRQLYDYTNYVKTQETPLPWRWLALESLREMSFSTQSDVWSFGITLWEIFSLGELPYSAGVQFSLDFIQKLQDGLRLLKPASASISVYDKMLECWHPKSAERPSFGSLHGWLHEVYENIQSHSQI